MAAHSSILTWEIPWTEEPGGLQSTGWQSQTWFRDETTMATGQVAVRTEKNTVGKALQNVCHIVSVQ